MWLINVQVGGMLGLVGRKVIRGAKTTDAGSRTEMPALKYEIWCWVYTINPIKRHQSMVISIWSGIPEIYMSMNPPGFSPQSVESAYRNLLGQNQAWPCQL